MIFDVTDSAITELKRIASEEDKDLRVRVLMKAGGCAGLSVDMNFTKWPHDPDFDEKFTISDIDFIVDAKSALFLQGAKLDYGGGLLDRGFKWEFPKATGGCGCGISFSF